MILGFSTQINSKPTYFIERIWEGLLRNHFDTDKEYEAFSNEHKAKFQQYWDWLPEEHERMTNPKIHTVRDDKNDRWQVGTIIDFFINVRTKNMFRFAPKIPVVRVQRVFMTYAYNDIIEISINGRQLHDNSEIMKFVQNDGFENWQDFFKYFHPKIMASEMEEYHAKLIHWTDLKY